MLLSREPSSCCLHVIKAKFKAWHPTSKNSCLKTRKNTKQNFNKLTHSCLFTSSCDWNRFTWIHLISELFAPTINDTADLLYAALPVWQPIRLTQADRYWFLRKDLKIPKLMREFIKSSAIISRELLLSVSLIYTKNFQSSQKLRAFEILTLIDSSDGRDGCCKKNRPKVHLMGIDRCQEWGKMLQIIMKLTILWCFSRFPSQQMLKSLKSQFYISTTDQIKSVVREH